jgi:hypothetical protein
MLCFRLFFVALFVGALFGQNPTTHRGLTFRPIAAEQSKALARIVMVSANPNQLHLYDPVTHTHTSVNLPKAPTSVSVSPDGLYAAAGHDALISYVNLSSMTLVRTIAAAANIRAVVLARNWVHTSPGGSYNLSTGALAPNSDILHRYSFSDTSVPRLHPNEKAIYVTRDSVSPNDLEKRDVSTGPMTAGSDSVYHGGPPVCGGVWFSPGNTERIYTGCGGVFRASQVQVEDMRYLTQFGGAINAYQSSYTFRSVDESQTGRVAGLIQPNSNSRTDNEIELYQSVFLTLMGRLKIPDVTVNSRAHVSHGKWVFFDTAGTSLWAVSQADGASGLLNDYFVTVFPLGTPAACNPTFGATSVQASGYGEVLTAAVTAANECLYRPQSNANWITIAKNSWDLSSGSKDVKYIVRPNTTGASRSGTISLGSTQLTITQAAMPAAGADPMTRLSHNVLFAAYSPALDSIVMVSSEPDEVHIYNPATRSERVFDLPRRPVSLGVSNLSTLAAIAVGMEGYIVHFDLTADVQRTIPYPYVPGYTVPASNGYVYAEPGGPVHVQTGALLRAPAQYFDSWSYYNNNAPPSLSSDNRVLFSPSPFDITSVTPVAMQGTVSSCSPYWISQNDTRLFDSCAKTYRISTASDPSSGQYAGAFSNTASGINGAAHSQARRSTVVLARNPNSSSSSMEVQVYGDEFLGYGGSIQFPKFQKGSASFDSSGQFVFWNNASTEVYVLLKAPSTAALAADMGLFRVGIPATRCVTSLSTASANIPAAGGVGEFSTVTPAGCVWEAKTQTPWITLTSGLFGFGTGSISYTLLPNNTGAARTGTITVGALTYTINQPSGGSISLNFTSISMSQQGGNFTVTVTASPSTLNWTAVSNASWVTITRNAAGTGSGEVGYQVSANPAGGAARTGTLTIGGEIFTIVQSASTLEPFAGLMFYPVNPCRVADTRRATGPLGGPSLTARGTRDFVIPGSPCGIPATAKAYALNVTAVPKGPLGYLTIWPSGDAQPLVSTLNSLDGRVKANAAIVPAGANGGVSVFVTDNADIVLDINGYFGPPTPAGLLYYPITPFRWHDTRTWGSNSYIRKGNTTLFGNNTYPAAKAFSLNATVIPRSGVFGYLTLWPYNLPQPQVSTLNAVTGTVTANAAIVNTDNYLVSAYVSDDADLVIDTEGYYAPAGSPGGLYLYTTPPCRIADTRLTSGTFGGPALFADTSRQYTPQQSNCAVPAAAKAYVVNATVIPNGVFGYLTLWGAGQARPTISTLNAVDGAITSNLAIIPAGTNGGFMTYVSNTAHAIFDISGYFAP